MGRRGDLGREFQLVNLATNPFGLGGVCREKRKGSEPFFAGGKKLVLRLKGFRASRDAHKFLAVDQRVTLVASQRPERQGGAAVMTIADWFDICGGHDRPGKIGLGCRRHGSAGRKRAEDINFGSRRETPSNVHSHEKNDEAKRAVDGILQFEKRRSETEKSEEAESLEKTYSRFVRASRFRGRVGSGW